MHKLENALYLNDQSPGATAPLPPPPPSLHGPGCYGSTPCSKATTSHLIIAKSTKFSLIAFSGFLHVAPVKCEQLYRLKAVIVHVGDIFCGHFVTYRRGPIGTRARNRWFYTSDILIRETTLAEVLKANAYMLFYEKVTNH
ncbi:unnamed protein product, partial [Meganyctiphanes norvegica]